MEWNGLVDLAKHTVAASAYGGPIGMSKAYVVINVFMCFDHYFTIQE